MSGIRLPGIDTVRMAVGQRYEVERLYGQGGMGAVYLARHRALGAPVAIKILPISADVEPEELTRFRREAALAANLPHPNIVPVYEFEVGEELAFLAMPFVDGITLAEHLRARGPLPYDEVRELLGQIGAGLAFAHERGVIHRDIKPANILRDEATGRWLITDFGIARAFRKADTAITRAGDVVGTPGYMAPEQAMGLQDVDARADLFALAAMACEALTGRRVDPLGDVREALDIVHATRPDVPRTVARALTAALAVDRDERPPSVAAWLTGLDAAQRGRRWRRQAAAGGGALLAAAGLWWFVGRTPDAPPPLPTVAVLPVEVTGTLEGVDLGTTLAQAFEEQLRWVVSHRVTGARELRRAAAARFGEAAWDPDSVAALARTRFGASQALQIRAMLERDDAIRIEVQLQEPATRWLVQQAAADGPLDSLSALVSDLVLRTFAVGVERERTGWSAAVPRGLEAYRAYYQGEQFFRAAAYDLAVERYDRVIALDSAFALAHFKRMLCEVLRLQPTRAATQVYASLDAARRYAAGLDPTTREILEGYEILVAQGDLDRAHDVFQQVALRHPNAVDAWFLLGYLQFNFGPLLGLSPAVARPALERAYELDPRFAAVIAQLARVAVFQHRETAARRLLGEYLQIDSTSAWAELARMVDSLLYQGSRSAMRVLGSFDTRPTPALEIIALAAGELEQPSLDRAFAEAAIGALWTRAATGADRAVAFRLQLVTHLGAGRAASADSLWREAQRRNVPQGELDRWTLLTAVTGIGTPADAEPQAAAGRLAGSSEADAVASWLTARWYRDRDRRLTAEATGRLRRIRARAGPDSLVAASLLDDLEALNLLAAGDSAAALEVWGRAIRRYSVAHASFGPLGAHWPLRLERARVAAALGQHHVALSTTESFTHMAGFADQVSWPLVLPLRAAAFRATGDELNARATYDILERLWRNANGRWAVLRDSVAAWKRPLVRGP